MTSLGELPHDWGDRVGEEARKTFSRYVRDGFFERFLAGTQVLDIGYKGYIPDATPILPHAIGVDLDYPNYDGRRLPFDDRSQDAVFTSHTLEHIADYRAAIAEWFRVVRVGGFLVIAVPHQFLYERKLALPSRWNQDHKRFYTSASLLSEIEEALAPFEYRIRYLEENDAGFDYSIPPDRHAGGSYEIVVVVERITPPPYVGSLMDEHPRKPKPSSGLFQRLPRPGEDAPVLAIEGRPPGFGTILVLKLDHRGDFIMAGSSFADLRKWFPESKLTLACGPWNFTAARNLGIFDEILQFEFFDETGPKADRIERLQAQFAKLVARRHFDLAIDLRVDDDTRSLLKVVDAAQRAGFGRDGQFPFLDISLPYINPTLAGRARRFVLPAERFGSHVGRHDGLEIIFSGAPIELNRGDPFLFGPWAELEAGEYEIELSILPIADEFQVRYDVCINSARDVLQVGVFRISHQGSPVVRLSLERLTKELEVRLHPEGMIGPFRFRGWIVTKLGSLHGPHQSEMHAMLVYLAALRARHPYAVRVVEPRD